MGEVILVHPSFVINDVLEREGKRGGGGGRKEERKARGVREGRDVSR